MVIVKSQDPKGCCYVETKGLDGETNLKMKSAPKKNPGLESITEITI